jgi:hypothetical protein
MRNAVIVLVCLLLLNAAFCGSETKADDGWKRIFDGKTLTGWKANERPENWTVKDGAIVGTGERSHLFYMAEEFKNFEFKVDVLTQPRTNSGIYFHTKFQARGWPAHGYESQVNVTHGDPVKTGSLYNVVKVFSTPAKDQKWWTQHIIVRGKRITVKIDDKVIFEYVERPGIKSNVRLSKGLFAFQQHDPGSVVQFKNVMVKRLPDNAR